MQIIFEARTSSSICKGTTIAQSFVRRAGGADQHVGESGHGGGSDADGRSDVLLNWSVNCGWRVEREGIWGSRRVEKRLA